MQLSKQVFIFQLLVGHESNLELLYSTCRCTCGAKPVSMWCSFNTCTYPGIKKNITFKLAIITVFVRLL